MTDLISGVATNLAVTQGDLVLIITFFGGWIFLAKGMRIGMIFYFLMFGVEYIIFKILTWDTQRVLTALFVSLLMLSISLYTSSRTATEVN